MATLAGKTIADTYTSLLKLEGDTQTLVARASGNAIQVKTGDDEATPLYLNTDAVGIGTSTPAKSLVIAGSGQQEIHVDAATNAYLLLDAGGNSDKSNVIFQKAGSTVGAIQYHHNATATSESLRIVVNESGSVDPQMVIQADGLVGIGTTSPSHSLTIASSSGNSPTLTILNESANDQVGGNIYFRNSHTDGVIDAGQVLGDIIWQATNNADADAWQNAAAIKVVAGDEIGTVGQTADSPGEIQFHTTANSSESLAQRMTIKSTGNVGIGTTTPDTLLEVEGTGDPTLHVQIKATTLTDTDRASFKVKGTGNSVENEAEIGVIYEASPSGGTNAPTGFIKLDASDGQSNYYWPTDGNVFHVSTDITNIGSTSGTVVGSQSSDERLKTISTDAFPYGLSQVNSITPIKYKYKNDPDNKDRLGFGAQTIQSIIPESVYDTNEDIDNNNTNKLAMEYVQLIPVLVKAVQELSVKVTALENA